MDVGIVFGVYILELRMEGGIAIAGQPGIAFIDLGIRSLPGKNAGFEG